MQMIDAFKAARRVERYSVSCKTPRRPESCYWDRLPDGSIKITTDPVSAPNHTSAEKLLRAIGEAGKTTRRARRGHGHRHTHSHGKEEHTH